MKKIFTLILGLGLSSAAFAQTARIHIFNDIVNHKLDLHFTMFTIAPSTCSAGAQAMDLVYLPPNEWAHYSTFATSTSAAGHPYPIDHWSPDLLSAPPFITNAQRWDYIKFSLSDPLNPGQIVPTLGGSVGDASCTGIPSNIGGTGSLNGVNYNFHADAYSFGGDSWINVQ
ncbi:hypothetical protein ASG22_17215 [Chryseobacterium sp. Leaf405]|uniref:hypothetical protein n=1 Tax=Chryseobacterium sp. Leaf405 TaxID=1736367 RepID=UPI0006F32576|nr:hypothetical protein [Chryseobacterium sp. Leaf405]KQT33840.1 hypothetical protein ASG22_17215 [Chryseobacterium sp. Leaf405]